MSEQLPILYSFRRCPYAMRARLALAVSGQAVELREVLLSRKPVSLLAKSAKATVPVMILHDGTVIDESLTVMHWALRRRDPHHWLSGLDKGGAALIEQCDGDFKQALDRYKYPNRYEDEAIDAQAQRDRACAFISRLDDGLQANGGSLAAAHPALADFAIFPFVRQFAAVDRDWWASTPYKAVRQWLQSHLDSALFARIMRKRKPWAPGDDAQVERWAEPDSMGQAA